MNVYEERNKKAEQLTQLLLSRTDFQDDIRQLRKEWLIPDDGLKTGQEHEDWYNSVNVHRDIDAFFKRNITKTFIKSDKYGLSSASWKPLLHYIMDGKVPNNFNGALPSITQTPDKNTGKVVYSMRFYEHTTEAEVRKVFGDFKTANLKDNRQQLIPALKLKKMQRANELRENGMSWKEVALTVNKELKGSLEYNDARKLVEQYKKHLSK